MPGIVFFLWIAIIASAVALFGYSIWNVIVVSRDFARMGQEIKR